MKTPRALVLALALVLTACGGGEALSAGDVVQPTQPPAPTPTVIPPAVGTVTVLAESGHHCPVVTAETEDECADRPVVGAVVGVLDSAGGEIDRGTTGADGRVSFSLPAGEFIVVPQPIDRYMFQPGPRDVTVLDGVVTEVRAFYNTGVA